MKKIYLFCLLGTKISAFLHMMQFFFMFFLIKVKKSAFYVIEVNKCVLK